MQVSYFQIEGSRNASYNGVTLPDISAMWFSWMDFAQFDSSGFFVCLFGIRYSIYARVVSIVAVVGVVLVVIAVVFSLLNRTSVAQPWEAARKKQNIRGVSLALLLFLHQPVSSTMLMLFNCQRVFGFERPWLRADLTKQCLTPGAALAIAIPSIFRPYCPSLHACYCSNAFDAWCPWLSHPI